MTTHDLGIITFESNTNVKLRLGALSSVYQDTIFNAGKVAARYKASEVELDADSQRIEKIRDLSGYNYDLFQDDPSQRPLLKEKSQNDTYDAIHIGSGWASTDDSDIELENKPYTYVTVVKVKDRKPVPLLRIGSTDKEFNDHVHRLLLDIGRDRDELKIDMATHGEPIEPSSYARSKWIPYDTGSDQFVVIAATTPSEQARDTSLYYRGERQDRSQLVSSNMLLDFDGPLSVGLWQRGLSEGDAEILEMIVYEQALGDQELQTVFDELDAAYDLSTNYLSLVLEAMTSFSPSLSAKVSLGSELESQGHFTLAALTKELDFGSLVLESDSLFDVPPQIRVRGLSNLSLGGESQVDLDQVSFLKGVRSYLNSEGSLDASLASNRSLRSVLASQGSLSSDVTSERGLGSVLFDGGQGSLTFEFGTFEVFLDAITMSGDTDLDAVLGLIKELESSLAANTTFDVLEWIIEREFALSLEGFTSVDVGGDVLREAGLKADLEGGGGPFVPKLIKESYFKPDFDGSGLLDALMTATLSLASDMGGSSTLDLGLLDRNRSIGPDTLGSQGFVNTSPFDSPFSFVVAKDPLVPTELRSLNPDGSERWSYTASPRDMICDDQGRVVFIEGPLNDRSLTKLDSDGSLMWSNTSVPNIDGLASDSNDSVYAYSGGDVIKYNGSTGSQIWNHDFVPFEDINAIGTWRETATSAPLVYVLTEDTLRVFQPNSSGPGSVLWSVNTEGSGGSFSWAFDIDGRTGDAYVARDDGSILHVPYDLSGSTVTYQIHDNACRWIKVSYSSAYAGGRIYLHTIDFEGYLTKTLIQGGSATEVWAYDLLSNTNITNASVGGLAIDRGGNVYVTETNTDTLTLFDGRTGNVRWQNEYDGTSPPIATSDSLSSVYPSLWRPSDNPSVHRGLSSNLDSEGLITANLGRDTNLDASLVSEGLVTANLGRDTVIDASLVSEGELITGLGLIYDLESQMRSTTRIDGDFGDNFLGSERGLDASLEGQGLITANLSQGFPLEVSLEGQGLVTSVLDFERGLDASLESEGLVTANLGRDTNLEASLVSEGLVTSVLGRDTNLESSLVSEGLVTSVLASERGLEASLVSEGLVTSVLGRDTNLDASLESVGNVSLGELEIEEPVPEGPEGTMVFTSDSDLNVN